MLIAFRNCVERLETMLTQEGESLRAHRFGEIREFNDRKSRGLLEMTRAARGIDPGTLEEIDRARLLQLRLRLADNQRLLLAHLNAAREISAMISVAIEASDSDGTYSTRVATRERPS